MGVDEAIKEAPSDARPAPPSGPTLSAVSVEPPALAVETAVERSSPVAEEMTVLSLSSPKAADLPEPEPEVGATDADSPAADAYVSLEDAFERVPGASEDPKRSEAPATSAEDATRESDLRPSAPVFREDTHDTHDTLGTTETRFAGGDGSDPAWTLRRGGGAAETPPEDAETFFGVGSLLGASLGSVKNAVAAVTTAASRSDLGSQSAADHVRGFGKELGTFAKHVAGEDLARRDDATTSANDEGSISKRDATRDDDRDDRDDLWSAFGAMAKHAAKSLETVAVAVASDPNVTRVASRSAAAAKRAVAAAETRAFDFLERTLGERSEESRVFAAIADADGVLLERALIERGCAAHLESLETLADAADAFAEERSDRLESEKEENHATSARSAFRADALASADAALDVERNREIETSDGDTTVDIARAGGPVPGEDASELTGAMRADASSAARDSAAAALAAFSDALRAREGLETPSETPSFPSPESIEAALRTSLEPTRRQSAARVADVTAAVVAHLVDVGAANARANSRSDGASGTGRARAFAGVVRVAARTATRRP